MIDLINYGFNERYLQGIDTEGYIPARVIEIHRDLYKVVSTYGEGNARLKGNLYNQTEEMKEYPAIGDFVLLKHNTMGDSLIAGVCPRKSKFSRPDYSGHSAGYAKTVLEQVVAANFDYVFILASLNFDFNVNRILRYVTVAWESGGIPVVLLTKADLKEDYTKQRKEIQSQAIGVEVHAVSAVTGLGLEELAKYMKPGNTIVFLGSSGVGKSTMVNALAGEEIMGVNGIRESDSKGRHTTTHRQLILLKNGAMIIDTPGMRELGIWHIKEGIGEAFSDIEELILQCRFSDCSHRNEPGCAVLKAMNEGSLAASRWKNYLRIKEEAKYAENKVASQRQKNESLKKISKASKAKQMIRSRVREDIRSREY